MNLAEALILCRCFNATDYIDKIYPVLGIIMHLELLMTPDYQLSSQEVFTTWTKDILLKGTSLVLHTAD